MSMKKSRIAMVDTQIRPADVTRYDLLEAFLTVARDAFVPQNRVFMAYGEHQIDLGDGRAMMTPRTTGKWLETATPRAGDEVLLVGAGSGYEAAVLASICDNVIVVEEDTKLAARAEENLRNQSVDNAVVVEGAHAEGAQKSGPYDLIAINGAVSNIPDALIDQLKDGGRLVAIIARDGVYEGTILRKSGAGYATKLVFNASAPMISGFEQVQEFQFI